jgi:hypothetical protein
MERKGERTPQAGEKSPAPNEPLFDISKTTSSAEFLPQLSIQVKERDLQLCLRNLVCELLGDT